MNRQERPGETRSDRREKDPDRHGSSERTVAPPIEREHETYQGIFEEDERREHERR